MSAQVPSKLRSLRSSVGSSTTAEALSLHPSLHETLVSFNLPASTTTRRLYDLLLELDHECLRHATDVSLDPAQDSTSEVESVVELAIFLSGSLSNCGHNGESIFQEVQLRALISSLALLQHSGVHTLSPDVYDKLRLKNISARFQKIAFKLQRSSTLADRIRYAPNVYLVQLASQYVSFINRGDSPWPSIFRPTVDIFFSALSIGGGQYNHIREIIGGLNQLVHVWQKPQKKYQALCGLQEYTRLATCLCREAAIADESGELRTAAAAIVSALVDKVDDMLAVENPNFPPELARRWHKALAVISRGPPDLDQGYHYYGLLDCISQLSAVSDPQMMGEGLSNRVKDLIFDSVVPEFRWKAIEILFSCHCTRGEQYRTLTRYIEIRATVETKANILEEMKLIQMHLESDEEEKLRFRISRPLTRASQNHSQNPVPPSDELDDDFGISPMPSNSGIPPFQDTHTSYTSWRESALTRSTTKNSTTFSLRSVRKFSNNYHSAGLLDGCQHALFYNDSEISVYQLGDLRTKTTSPSFSMIFTKQFKNSEIIRNVSSSQAFVIIVTNKRLLVFKIDADGPIDTILHGDWDPSGLVCHESKTHLVVFLGQSQRNEANKYNGQIKVYRYRMDGQASKLPVFALNMPANDCPKRVSFDKHSQILTCITRIENRLLVWILNDDFLSSSEPFEFFKNKYTAVRLQSPAVIVDIR